MKRLLLTLYLLMSSAISYAYTDVSGTYKCVLFDKNDGGFDATLSLKLNKQATIQGTAYSSYDLDFNVVGLPYSYVGIAAAQGSNLAIYFESSGDKKNPDDRGVGIATVVLDKDKSGKETISLHKFYYEKSYKGNANYGFENCKKIK